MGCLTTHIIPCSKHNGSPDDGPCVCLLRLDLIFINPGPVLSKKIHNHPGYHTDEVERHGDNDRE